MSMTKKEQAEVDALKFQLELAQAWKRTDKVDRDLPPPPLTSDEVTHGWLWNLHTMSVDKCTSSSIFHSRGEWKGKNDRNWSQNPCTMYSTEVLALKAMRHALEEEFCSKARVIDLKIKAAMEGKTE